MRTRQDKNVQLIWRCHINHLVAKPKRANIFSLRIRYYINQKKLISIYFQILILFLTMVILYGLKTLMRFNELF